MAPNAITSTWLRPGMWRIVHHKASPRVNNAIQVRVVMRHNRILLTSALMSPLQSCLLSEPLGVRLQPLHNIPATKQPDEGTAAHNG
jgi:hypothetical protein